MEPTILNTDVRSLFISDLHLGSRYCHPRPVTQLIRKLLPEHLYLVGDICDGWLLRRDWRWSPDYVAFMDSLQYAASHGTRISYLLGNHDRCLQRWIADWGDLWVGEKCVHELADGRRLFLIHGDQFDGTQNRFRKAANFSARIHEGVLGGSRLANRILGELGVSSKKIATALSVPFKSVAHSVSQFRPQAQQLAIKHGCEGVLFGHTHTPRLQEDAGFLWANTGDWLEHCSAITETTSGQLELWMGNGEDWLRSSKRQQVVPARPASPSESNARG